MIVVVLNLVLMMRLSRLAALLSVLIARRSPLLILPFRVTRSLLLLPMTVTIRRNRVTLMGSVSGKFRLNLIRRGRLFALTS